VHFIDHLNKNGFVLIFKIFLMFLLLKKMQLKIMAKQVSQVESQISKLSNAFYFMFLSAIEPFSRL